MGCCESWAVFARTAVEYVLDRGWVGIRPTRVARARLAPYWCTFVIMLITLATMLQHHRAAAWIPFRASACLSKTFVTMSTNDPLADSLVRLDKLLSERGAGSRKDVDKLIRKGLVTLNGEVVGKSDGKLKVPFSSCPIVDGYEYAPPPLLVAYYKPLGVVSSMRDDRGRADLATVLPLEWQSSMHPVGRLDADTTGLLLFSRDGDLTHRLLHPRFVVEREYLAEVEHPIDAAALGAQLAEGVETIEEGESLVVQAQLLEVTGQTVRLVVTEGKYRMVRRVLANAGHPVLDALELEEGDAVAIEGDALEWATSLAAAAPSAGSRSSRSSEADAPHRLVEKQTRQPVARMDLAAAMEAAWTPRESDVLLVVEQADVAREEAVEALRRHRGDIVATLEELL
jgi:23S rRNA pseudouridine2605 synthase